MMTDASEDKWKDLTSEQRQAVETATILLGGVISEMLANLFEIMGNAFLETAKSLRGGEDLDV